TRSGCLRAAFWKTRPTEATELDFTVSSPMALVAMRTVSGAMAGMALSRSMNRTRRSRCCVGVAFSATSTESLMQLTASLADPAAATLLVSRVGCATPRGTECGATRTDCGAMHRAAGSAGVCKGCSPALVVEGSGLTHRRAGGWWRACAPASCAASGGGLGGRRATRAARSAEAAVSLFAQRRSEHASGDGTRLRGGLHQRVHHRDVDQRDVALQLLLGDRPARPGE